jgi:hypothetical protein
MHQVLLERLRLGSCEIKAQRAKAVAQRRVIARRDKDKLGKVLSCQDTWRQLTGDGMVNS